MSPSDALHALLFAPAAGRTGPFLVPGDPDRPPLGYARAWDRIRRAGTLFREAGLAPGDRVLVMTRDPEASALAVLGALAFGLSSVLADPEEAPAELAHVLAAARPRLGLVDRELMGTRDFGDLPLRPVAPPPPSASLLGRLLGRAPRTAPDTFPALLDGRVPADLPAALDGASEAYVVFTSGSSGPSKGVRISRDALAAHLGTLGRRWGIDGRSRLFNGLPLFHVDGLVQGPLLAWTGGAAWIRPEAFTLAAAAGWMDALYRERATHFVVVPTLLALLLDHTAPAGGWDGPPAPDLRLVVSTAAALDPPLWARAQAAFGVPVANVYGLTETVTGGCFCGPEPEAFRMGTVGRPVDCEVRIAGPDGRPQPPGAPGELWMRGPNLLMGYLDGSRGLTEDGWFPTGDLAVRDADGFVRVTGRLKNLVISGGNNIQPEEVAAFLRGLPEVAEAEAFGRPDPVFGEVLVACVVPRPGAAREAILAQCRRGLNPVKVPREMHLMEALPRGPSGKVELPALRERCAALGRQDPRGAVPVRVRALAAEAFQVPEASLHAGSGPLDTPGWDSFAHLQFILALEAAFGIALSTGDIVEMRTLGDVEAAVARRAAGTLGQGPAA